MTAITSASHFLAQTFDANSKAADAPGQHDTPAQGTAADTPAAVPADGTSVMRSKSLPLDSGLHPNIALQLMQRPGGGILDGGVLLKQPLGGKAFGPLVSGPLAGGPLLKQLPMGNARPTIRQEGFVLSAGALAARSLVNPAVRNMTAGIKDISQFAAGAKSLAPNSKPSGGESFFDKIGNAVKGAATAVEHAVEGGAKVVQGAATAVEHAMEDGAKSVVNGVKDTVESMSSSGIGQALLFGMMPGVGAVAGLVNAVSGGESLFDTIGNAVKGAATAVEHAVEDGAKSVVNGVKDAVEGMSPSDIGHTLLDFLGMIPGVGAIADLANAAWYAAEGDWVNAAMSAAGAIPGVGEAIGAAKIAKNAVKGAAKAAKGAAEAGKVAKGAEKAAKGAEKAAEGAKGVGGKLPETAPKAPTHPNKPPTEPPSKPPPTEPPSKPPTEPPHKSPQARFVTSPNGVTVDLTRRLPSLPGGLDRATFSTKISAQKQGRHVSGKGYAGGSYFESADQAQRVLDAFHNGPARMIEILGVKKNGDIVVRVPEVTGRWVNRGLGAGFPGVETHVFFIKGTKYPSVVPYNPAYRP